MTTLSLTEVQVDLTVAHTDRLRCPGCHRFVATVGTKSIRDERCGIHYILTEGPGIYTRVALS